MASSSDVVKKVVRFKLQLSHSTDSATVLKILQKLKDLEITLDVLAETGIGKTVNSLRKHKHAGEFAKALVRGWKRLVPKESTSHTDDGDASESFSVKDELDDQNCPNNGSLATEDLNNNCVTSHNKSQNASYEAVLKTESREADSEKHYEKEKRYEDHDENQEKDQQENQNNSQNGVMNKKLKIQKDEMDNSVVSKEKRNDQRKRKSGDDDTSLRNKKSDSTETLKSNSDGGRFVPEKESNNKSQSLEDGKESLSFEFGDKRSNTLKLANVKDDRSSETAGCSDRKRKKTGKEKHGTLKEYEHQGLPGHKNQKTKIKHNDEEKDNGPDEPCMSFESYLNYDLNVFKRKDRAAVKKPPQKIKTAVKEEATKDLDVKAFKPSAVSVNVSSPKQHFKETVMDLLNLPLPACLPVCEKPSGVEFFERKAEESDLCDISEEAAVFTGQRLNRKMQVYSGAKTVFLPTMMSLHQQCIRTLQNNIDLLYETGGVPFEILEPVLERCTPEQLLRIEECNPIYMGVTDHLWGKHCQREFKDSRLLEYESWKEMYIRLSEERERKLQRLTKSIVSAHSNKPKGRQVKMAFIHTVAKPPRDVRIQQEIHGTAVPQPHQLRCSVKVQDNRARPSWSVVSRSSSSSSSGAGNAQDPRKKPRVAPMMVKSLKAFKKQLGRR